jgi:YVTN family beta-propeller protein
LQSRLLASRRTTKIILATALALSSVAGAPAARAQEPATSLLSVRSMAINPATGKFYAVEPAHGTVAAVGRGIDGTTHIKTGDEPLALAINSKTNRIYVVNHGSGTLSIIDGERDAVLQTINVGALPYVVAVNETTSRIYVSNVFSDEVTVIDGATNAAQKIKAGSADTITIDDQRDKIYLAGYQSTKLVTLNQTPNGEPNIAADVNVGYHAWGNAIDEAAGLLYVTRVQDAALLIIDESTGATVATIPVGYIPCAVALNPAKNRAYVVNHASDSVSVIDTKKRTVLATVKVGSSPQGIAVDPSTGLIYVANSHSASISVIDGSTNHIARTLTTNTTSNKDTKPYNVVVSPGSTLDNYTMFVALEGDPSYEMTGLIEVTQSGETNREGK